MTLIAIEDVYGHPSPSLAITLCLTVQGGPKRPLEARPFSTLPWEALALTLSSSPNSGHDGNAYQSQSYPNFAYPNFGPSPKPRTRQVVIVKTAAATLFSFDKKTRGVMLRTLHQAKTLTPLPTTGPKLPDMSLNLTPTLT